MTGNWWVLGGWLALIAAGQVFVLVLTGVGGARTCLRDGDVCVHGRFLLVDVLAGVGLWATFGGVAWLGIVVVAGLHARAWWRHSRRIRDRQRVAARLLP